MIRSGWCVYLAVAAVGPGLLGCNHHREAEPVVFGFLGSPATLAVAPAHDLSGTGRLDPLVLTDAFASELTQVPQIDVVPVNQMLAVMYGQGWRVLEAPEQAAALARMVNADGVIVIAVTEYDPYDPPRLGLIAEVYMIPASRTQALAGEEVTRAARPITSRPAVPAAPRRQVQRVFDASRLDEQARIRTYAATRAGQEAQDWQSYLRNQQLFVRYCCWRTVRELVGGPSRLPAERD